MLRLGILMLLIAPWLIPPQGGASPALLPILFSVACLALMLGGVSVAVSSGYISWRQTMTAMPPVLAGAWLLAALLSCLIGLCQYFGVAQYFAFMSTAGMGEAYANLRQRNQFATLANIGLVALLWWATQPSSPRRARSKFWIEQLATTLLAAGAAASMSRTGLIQLLLIAVLYLNWTPGDAKVRRILIAAVLAYSSASLLLTLLAGRDVVDGSILSRFQNTGSECDSRLILWSNVLHLIGERPWLGWGWGELDYAHFITIYDGPRFCQILDNAHNLPLHLAVELGLPLAGLICALVLCLAWRARPWRETEPSRQLAWAVLTMILFHSLLEYPLWFGPFQMASGLCLVLLWRSKPGEFTYQAEKTTTKPCQKWTMFLASGILMAGSYAAWDYYRVSQIFYPPAFRAPAYRDNTLEKIRGTWLFQDQVQFAEFTMTPLTPENAAYLYEMGQRVLHYSPEARVAEKLVECAVLLGRDDAARFYLARYKAAFPKEHARWAARQLEPPKPH